MMKKLIPIFIILMLAASCGRKSEVKLSVHPQHPIIGEKLTISWQKPVYGFLWIQEFYGDPPVYRKITILPIKGEKSYTITPEDSTYLVLFTLEDTTTKTFYPAKNWRYVVFKESGKLSAKAYFVLLNNGIVSPDSIPSELKNSCLLRQFYAKKNPEDLLNSNDQKCLLGGFLASYNSIHDSAFASRFYKKLRGTYRTYAELILASINPSGNIRRSQKAADRFWSIYKNAPGAAGMVKSVKLFRWFITRYFMPPERFDQYRSYINSLRHLTMYDFYVLEDKAVWPEVDTSRLSFILSKESEIVNDTINVRWDYAFRLRAPSDFNRIRTAMVNDYLKNLTRLYLAKEDYEKAYATIKKFVGDKDLFTLWDEDLLLYGEAALEASHLEEAEKALTIARYFHQDTSATNLLKKIWKKKHTGMTFAKYMASLKDTLKTWLPKAPSFNVRTLDGKTFVLDSLRGKVVVLNFWATWCSPCRREIPELNKLVDKYGNRVVFIGITDEDSARVVKFLKKQPFKYHIVVNGKDVRKLYHVNAFPTHFMISQSGYIVFKQVGYIPGTAERLKAEIEKLLK